MYGEIKNCNIVADRKGLSKGYGFVTYKEEATARKLIHMAKVQYNHKILNISRAIRKKNTGQYKGTGVHDGGWVVEEERSAKRPRFN